MSRAPRPRPPVSLDAGTASRWHPDDLAALADLVAERLAERLDAPRATGWLTAAQVADLYGVTRSWVYERAGELGGVRLGSGPRGRLRFDAERVAAALSSRDASGASQAPRSPVVARSRRRAARAPADSPAHLLPIRGRGG